MLEKFQSSHAPEKTGLSFEFAFGRALKNLGRPQQAIAHLEAVLGEQSDHIGAQITLADCLKAVGRIDEAAVQFRRTIENHPDNGLAWWSLSNLKSSEFSDDELLRLRELARTSRVPADQACFEFALGKACEDQNLYSEAFGHYQQGNQIKRQLEPWDRDGFRRWLNSLKTAFEDKEIPQSPAIDERPRVVFIVSLPRSGSTLTEQILAAHSEVSAASELPWLPELIAGEARSRKQGLANWAARASASELSALREAYYQKSQYWHQNRAVFTDKLPGNFPFTPLILQMMPEALIVNVRRDPMDVCWSCYRQMFIRGSEFAYDLEDLAAYWTDHQRYMQFWADVAPQRVLQLDYESLVDDFESEVKRLLAFLGLPFEKACLNFHQAERAVNTASAAQVREKVHTRGVGHWQNYREWLGPLQDALDRERKL